MMQLRTEMIYGLCSTVLCTIAFGPAATAAAATIRHDATRWILGNADVERVVETKPFLHTVSITNKMAGPARVHPVESRGFRLWLDDDRLVLTAADFEVGTPEVREDAKEDAKEDADGVQLGFPLRCEKHGVRVTVIYRLGRNAFYFRKLLKVDPGDHLLNKIDVELFRLADLELRRFDQRPIPFRMVPWDIAVGRPLLAGNEFFFGVEHPASYNILDEQEWIALRQHPGRKDKVVSSPAVIGLCPDKPRRRVLDYFERYIDENRARRVKRTVQWIAYFEAKMDDDACRKRIAVAEKVFARRGAPIDVVAMDSGWTDPQSIMRISRKYPNRLALMSKLAKERLGAELGLHVITSGVKPMVDKDWLAAQGYDMIYHKSRSAGAYCFADPRVLAEFRDNLVRYVRQYGIVSYKFDWGHFACGAEGHRGHLPGKEYGFEAGATNYIRVHKALREVDPDIFLFNTGWYSPWWLWSYDAVFAAGADYNFGLNGPPSFSTASLLCTWRDATIRGNIVEWSPFFPINSLMTVDPISYWWHDWNVCAESPLRPFTDYFVTACLRGTQMIEIYNNIAAWSDAHADAVAAVLKWMKAHDDVILASTRYFGGDPLRGQPYGYAHFTKDNRGIVVVRNPDVVPRAITIPFDEKAGVWPGKKEYVVRTVYPFTVVAPDTLHYGSRVEQRLSGHEVRVLEIWPVDALPEPMPIGCRYQVTARETGKTKFRLARWPEPLELFSPVALQDGTPVPGAPHRYTVHRSDHPARQSSVPAKAKMQIPGAPLKNARVDGGRYVVPIRIAEGCRARVAFVFRRSGLKGEGSLDGKSAAADAPHLRLSDAKNRTRGSRARASNWSLFGFDVSPGKHELRFQLEKTDDRRAPDTTVQQAFVVADVYAKVEPEYTLEVGHSPLTRSGKVLLPQNWAWEKRQVATVRLPNR